MNDKVFDFSDMAAWAAKPIDFGDFARSAAGMPPVQSLELAEEPCVWEKDTEDGYPGGKPLDKFWCVTHDSSHIGEPLYQFDGEEL